MISILAFCALVRAVEPSPSAVEEHLREVVVRAPDPARARALVRRIGVVGASAASGFGSGLRTARVLGGALRARERIADVSTVRHFVDPIGIGRAEIRRIRRYQPTVVFATDYLFWYAAGSKGIDGRLADLAHAFALLESLDCPVFVGDIPAVDGADERMIAPWQIVPEEERIELNDAIHAWADGHDDIHVVPLAAWYDIARNGGVIAIDGSSYEVEPGQALRDDRLHPTRVGQVMLGLLLLQHFDAAYPGLDTEQLRLDPQRLWRRHAPLLPRPRRVGAANLSAFVTDSGRRRPEPRICHAW
jgi:hypothetical protein